MKLKTIYYQATVLEMRNKRRNRCLPEVVYNEVSQKEREGLMRKLTFLGLYNYPIYSQECGIFCTIIGKLVGEDTDKKSAKGVQKQCLMPVPQDHTHQKMGKHF